MPGVKPKPVSWALLAKWHRHVQSIHFKIIAYYWLLSILLINNKLVFCAFDFYRFSTSISINRWVKSIIIDDIDWFPISIFILNYVWCMDRTETRLAVLRQSFLKLNLLRQNGCHVTGLLLQGLKEHACHRQPGDM